MKIMCIYPGATLPGFASLKAGGSNEAVYINHGLAMISAVLKREGHDIYCNDLRGFQNWEDFDNQVKNQQFDMALITFMSCDELYAMRCLEIVKKYHPKIPTVAGGIHLSVTRPKQFLYADCVVLGEGEEVIIDISRHYEQHGYIPPFYEAKPIANLDSLPFVDRENFNTSFEQGSPLLPLLPTPFVTIIFSRGCDYRCKFCFPSRQLIAGGTKRMRSVENCIEEIYLLKGSSGIGSLMIHDDLFPENPEWIGKFCEQLLSTSGRIPFWAQMRSSFIYKHPDSINKLAEAGLTWISLGAESGSDRMLKFLKKGVTVEQNIEAANIAHKNNINLFFNYILGLPGETKEDVEATEKMLKQILPAWHSCSIYTAYPGSELYNYCWDNNLFTGEHYRMTRYPYERKVKGIDYDYVFAKITEFGSYKSELRKWSKPIVQLVNANIAKTTPNTKITTDKIQQNNVTTIIHQKDAFPSHITLPIKTKPPKVSVIMTSYNRPKLLKEAFQSIFNQTMKDWEIIMVDASTDLKIYKILNKFSKDKRITVLSDTEGMGNVGNISRAWNKGLDHAQGEYICFLDDDNRKKSTYCEEMSKYLDKHPDKDAVCCFSDIIDLKGNKLKQLRFPTGFNKKNILKANYIDSGEIMIRQEVFNKVGYFDERLTTNDDWDMIIRILYESQGIGMIEKPLVDYRQHPDRRMNRTNEYNVKTLSLVKSKRHPNHISVTLSTPPPERLTISQRQVCNAIREALHWAEGVKTIYSTDIDKLQPKNLESSNLLIVPAPFEVKLEEMKILVDSKTPIVTIHMEDPQGVITNKERDRFATWVVTNDVSTIPYYQKVIKDPNKVIFCPSLSISESILSMKTKKYDMHNNITICGHAYPSRINFVRKLLELLSKKVNLHAIGNGWEKLKDFGPQFTYIPTQDELSTMSYYRHTDIVVCLHRTEEDIGGFPLKKPESVHRGYIEAYSGALTMIDNNRQQHSFGENEVVFFSGPKDLKKKIDYYLANPKIAQAMARKARRRATRDFTFRARMTKIINCIRSERYNTIIP